MKLLYPGSFDPFTVGHADIVKRALSFADSIVIGVGINDTKKPLFSMEERINAISRYYESDKRIEVRSYTGLTVQLAHEVGADAFLRGVRSISDLDEERMIAGVNRSLCGIETVFLLSSPEFLCVSSSAVKELMRNGVTVDNLMIDTFPKK